MLHVYTDGGCRPKNPGYGAAAYVILDSNDKVVREKAHVNKNGTTTNQRMEMSAIIAALGWIKDDRGCVEKVKVYTDSQYVQKGITEWIHKWKANGWRTYSGSPVKNVDLWVMLENYVDQFDIIFEWVRGHNGNKWNEKVDSMCSKAIKNYFKI